MRVATKHIEEVLLRRLLGELDAALDGLKTSGLERLFHQSNALEARWWERANDDPWARAQMGHPDIDGTVVQFQPGIVVSQLVEWQIPDNIVGISVSNAVDAVHENRLKLAERAAAHLRAIVDLVLPSGFAGDVSSSQQLLVRWPWPLATGTSTETRSNWALLRALLDASARGGPVVLHGSLMLVRDKWPKVEPQDLARWAGPKLGNAAPEVLKSLRRAAKHEPVPGGRVMPGGFSFETAGGREIWLSTVGLARLFQAAKRIANSDEHNVVEAYPVSADRIARRITTVLVGGSPESLERDGAETHSTDKGVRFTWAAPRMTVQVRLGTTIDGRIGNALVRNLMGLVVLGWAGRATPAPTDMYWFWPNDLLWIAGMKATDESRQAVMDSLHVLSNIMLKADYPDSGFLRGPLVTVGETDGTATLVHVHGALFRSVVNEQGLAGPYWWAVPRSIFGAPANGHAGRIHAFAQVLSGVLRPQIGRRRSGELRFRMSGERLSGLLGVKRRQDRAFDRRAAKILYRTLEAAKEFGIIESWWTQGDLAQPGCVVTAKPIAPNIDQFGALPRLPVLPATGDDLQRWMANHGHTSVRASTLLGVPGSTLRRLMVSHAERPLPSSIRDAFRRLLWGGVFIQGG
jgi:hypothetical protein